MNGVSQVFMVAKRFKAWDKLRSLNSSPERPWLYCGNFNEIVR